MKAPGSHSRLLGGETQGVPSSGTPSTSTIAPLRVPWGCAPAQLLQDPLWVHSSYHIPTFQSAPRQVWGLLATPGTGRWGDSLFLGGCGAGVLGVLGLQWPGESLSHSGAECWGHLFVGRRLFLGTSPWCNGMSGQGRQGHPCAGDPGVTLPLGARAVPNSSNCTILGWVGQPMKPKNGHQCLG